MRVELLVREHEGETRPPVWVGMEVQRWGVVLARHRLLFRFLGKFSSEDKGLYRRTLDGRIPDPVSAQGPSAPKGAPP